MSLAKLVSLNLALPAVWRLAGTCLTGSSPLPSGRGCRLQHPPLSRHPCGLQGSSCQPWGIWVADLELGSLSSLWAQGIPFLLPGWGTAGQSAGTVEQPRAEQPCPGVTFRSSFAGLGEAGDALQRLTWAWQGLSPSGSLFLLSWCLSCKLPVEQVQAMQPGTRVWAVPVATALVERWGTAAAFRQVPGVALSWKHT